MSQISDKLLQCLRKECCKTGKTTFDMGEMFSYLENSQELANAIKELTKYGLIKPSKYVNCFDLLKP